MKILILANSFHPTDFDSKLIELASYLRKTGHQVIGGALCSKTKYSETDRYDLARQMIRTWAAGSCFLGLLADPIRWVRLMLVIRQEPPDIMHSHQKRSHFAAFLVHGLFPNVQWIRSETYGHSTGSIKTRKIFRNVPFSRKTPVEILHLYQKAFDNSRILPVGSARDNPSLSSSQNPLLDQPNLDPRTVERFGLEWRKFHQPPRLGRELYGIWKTYFRIFPLKYLHSKTVGCDFGCGSGRWAKFVAPKVGKLFCVDASGKALEVARRNLAEFNNIRFEHASLTQVSVRDAYLDFGYCLGVLHHLPDPLGGMRACVKKLKIGAPFLIYVYQSISSKPLAWRLLFWVTSVLRNIICRLPNRLLEACCDVIAITVYYPFARISRWAEVLRWPYEYIPLSFYRNLSLYTMRTDARDRFGTPLEHRFSKDQIHRMMRTVGLGKIRFSYRPPYWTALGYRER